MSKNRLSRAYRKKRGVRRKSIAYVYFNYNAADSPSRDYPIMICPWCGHNMIVLNLIELAMLRQHSCTLCSQLFALIRVFKRRAYEVISQPKSNKGREWFYTMKLGKLKKKAKHERCN